MRTRRSSARCSLALTAVLFAGCSVSMKATRSPSPASANDLLAADRAFAAEVAREGTAAWARWFDPHGAQLVPGQIVRGDSARRALMTGLLDDPSLKLLWEPDTAVIAASGDMGYTIGRSQVRQTNPDGSVAVRSTGRHLTIWRRQPDGSWKVELDTGKTDPKPRS